MFELMFSICQNPKEGVENASKQMHFLVELGGSQQATEEASLFMSLRRPPAAEGLAQEVCLPSQGPGLEVDLPTSDDSSKTLTGVPSH